jgi:hypothetical protein
MAERTSKKRRRSPGAGKGAHHVADLSAMMAMGDALGVQVSHISDNRPATHLTIAPDINAVPTIVPSTLPTASASQPPSSDTKSSDAASKNDGGAAWVGPAWGAGLDAGWMSDEPKAAADSGTLRACGAAADARAVLEEVERAGLGDVVPEAEMRHLRLQATAQDPNSGSIESVLTVRAQNGFWGASRPFDERAQFVLRAQNNGQPSARLQDLCKKAFPNAADREILALWLFSGSNPATRTSTSIPLKTASFELDRPSGLWCIRDGPTLHRLSPDDTLLYKLS